MTKLVDLLSDYYYAARSWYHDKTEFLATWREGRRYGVLCFAYGGTMPNGRVRACDKFRGHLDSHTYEFIDVITHGERIN